MPTTIHDYQRETKTKYIESLFKGLPELKNEYGSLNKILKKVLTEPYNETKVTSITIKENTIEVNLGLNHGFNKNQVVKIKSVSDLNFNLEFRVLSIGTLIVTLVKPDFVLDGYAFKDDYFIEGSPLGYDLVYENITTGINCYKNKSVNSPGILRVIDKLPPNEYLETWSKYGRVTIGSEINSEGKFVNNFKAPYHRDYPYVEETGDGVKGASGIHGFAKWTYSVRSGYNSAENIAPTGTFPTRWRIVGDDRCFYLMINTTGNLSDASYSYDLVGFGNYSSYNTAESYNVCLQARDGFMAASNDSDYNPSRQRSFFGALNYNYSGFILTDLYGNVGTGYNRSRATGRQVVSSTYVSTPWRDTSLKTINPRTGYWFTTNLVIKDSLNYLRGEHRGVSILYGNYTRLPDTYVTKDGDLFLDVQEPLYMSSYTATSMMFSLKNWKEVL